MQYHLLAVILFTNGALATCAQDGRSCYWDSKCAKYQDDVGFSDAKGEYAVVASTKFDSVSTLYKKQAISRSCYNDYGSGCFSGWARLWCDKRAPAEPE